MKVLRGQVWYATLDEEIGPKPYLIVSNNLRNQKIDTVLAVRITSTLKREHLESNYRLPHTESLCMVGVVIGDHITEIYKDELDPAGPKCALSTQAMRGVEKALQFALGMS